MSMDSSEHVKSLAMRISDMLTEIQLKEYKDCADDWEREIYYRIHRLRQDLRWAEKHATELHDVLAERESYKWGMIDGSNKPAMIAEYIIQAIQGMGDA